MNKSDPTGWAALGKEKGSYMLNSIGSECAP